MKFYRRHKHELEYADTDAPLPTKPEKKMRYSKADDVLLARFFADKREGTSDKIFQQFARTVSHLHICARGRSNDVIHTPALAPSVEGMAGTLPDTQATS